MVYVIFGPDSLYEIMFISANKGRALEELRNRGFNVERVEEVKPNREYRFYGHDINGNPFGLWIEVHQII